MTRTLLVLAIIVLAFTVPPRAAENWHITATVAESCSCTVSCPCNFGGEPTRNPCEGNRLIAIKSGHYGDVDLANVSFLVTFQMRGWSKIYVSDRVTDRQKDAVEALLPIAFAGFHRGMLSFTKAPITMEITDKRVTFWSPESSVEMEAMKGFDGRNVKIMNLPSAAYQDYTQFKSVSHKHSSADHAFSHSGTNGFTSTMDVGSK
ncbi:MAG TPA: DUF1326 domain-containing protein [Vicinamibacterales bacterium]|nr:DUF1326 domain-containing protein [Vicinamibacterales bacterium]